MSVESSISTEIHNTPPSNRDEKSIGDDLVAIYKHDITQHPMFDNQDAYIPLTERVQNGISAQVELKSPDETVGLSPAKKRKLASIAADGLVARNEMVLANTGFVMSLAKSYQNRGIEYIDLIQEGNIGLMRAAELFNPDNEKGANFGTYAKLWINSCMSKAIHRQARTIAIPLDKSIQLQKLNTLERKHTDLTGNKLSQDEIEKTMKMSHEEIKELRASVWAVFSISTETGTDDNSNLESIIADPITPSVEEQAVNSKTNETLMDELEKMLANSQLSADEKTVVWMHYIEDQTVETIAQVLARDTRYVYSKAKWGLKKLQDQFNDDQEQTDYFRDMLTAVRNG